MLLINLKRVTLSQHRMALGRNSMGNSGGDYAPRMAVLRSHSGEATVHDIYQCVALLHHLVPLNWVLVVVEDIFRRPSLRPLTPMRAYQHQLVRHSSLSPVLANLHPPA